MGITRKIKTSQKRETMKPRKYPKNSETAPKMKTFKHRKPRPKRLTRRRLPQLGGIDAADQGLQGTCYAESATRAIIKILKHPEFRLVSDIVSGVLSESLYNKYKDSSEYPDYAKDIGDDEASKSDKQTGESGDGSKSDAKDIETEPIKDASTEKIYKVKPETIKEFNDIPGSNKADKTDYLKEHPILKAILNEQNLYYGSVLTCSVQIWGWALGGDPETVCKKIIGFVNSKETNFRTWMYKGIILQLRSEPKCVKVKYDMDSAKPDTVIAEKSEENPNPQPEKNRQSKGWFTKDGSDKEKVCDGDNKYFDRTGEILIQLREKIAKSGWKLEMESKSFTQGNMLNPIPKIILDGINGKFYPILSISMDKTTIFGKFQRDPKHINEIADTKKVPLAGRKASNIGHAMIIRKAGYTNGKGYITLKNSWGTKWGDHGMITITNPAVFYTGQTKDRNPTVYINITSFMLTKDGKRYGKSDTKIEASTTDDTNPGEEEAPDTIKDADNEPNRDISDINGESDTGSNSNRIVNTHTSDKSGHVSSDKKLHMNMVDPEKHRAINMKEWNQILKQIQNPPK